MPVECIPDFRVRNQVLSRSRNLLWKQNDLIWILPLELRSFEYGEDIISLRTSLLCSNLCTLIASRPLSPQAAGTQQYLSLQDPIA
jgi:hypothetical protein